MGKCLVKDFVYYIIKMYDFHGDIGFKELTASRFGAWLGIHLMLHKWRYPVIRGMGRSVEYVVLDISGLDSDYGGGIDVVERLNMGLHEPEGIDSAHRWITIT